MLSIVIPVHNAPNYLKSTLYSVIDTTDNLSEIVIVDDCSDQATQEFINSITTTLPIRITKTRNHTHSWTNASWNIGTRLATGDYIAVLNSDITLSPHWDTHLIKLLSFSTIACPTEKRGDKHFTLDPVIQRVDPNMIKGACFMFRRQDTKKLFPIPSTLIHWAGDNFLADKANTMKGVAFSAEATITHAITQSGRTVDSDLYREITLKDVLAYQEMSGRDMSLVLHHAFNIPL